MSQLILYSTFECPSPRCHKYITLLKGYAGCHVTRLHIMTFCPLSRVMMVKPPCHAQNVENSCFLCAKFSPVRPGLWLHCPDRHSDPVDPPVDWVAPAVSGRMYPPRRFHISGCIWWDITDQQVIIRE